MDRAAKEIEAIENAVAEATKAQILELDSLELSYVGGGCADTLFK